MIDEKFIILAVLFYSAGGMIYLLDTLKGKTKPNRVTWFLWGLLGLVAFAGMLDEKASVTSLIFILTSTLVPFVILAASFISKRAVWKINNFDWICGTLSICGIIAWLITGVGNLAITFSIIADFFALLPTVIKALKAPSTESGLLYLNVSFASFITLLTIDIWSFSSIAYAMYLMIICVIMFVIIRFRIGPRLRSI